MSRLLHAAARGARIQEKTSILSFPAVKNRWATIAAYIPTADYKGDDYRIHPNDAHLQYGPISTGIRNITVIDLHSEDMPFFALSSACLCGIDGTWAKDWRKQSVSDRATAMLILAEALAEEGL